MIEVTMFTPPAVTKRNEFSAADECVENALPHLPQAFQHVNFRAWLLKYTEGVIRQVASNFATGASRGIEQTAQLLCDPDYYAVKKKRREAWKKNLQEQQAQQERARIERKLCPTAEQIAQDIKWATEQFAYHETQAAACKAALERLNEMKPKNIRLVPRREKK